MVRDILLKLIKDDHLGFLDVKQQSITQSSDTTRLIESFREINHFICETGREPQENKEDMEEYGLYSRLNHFRENKEKIDTLQKYDEFNILSTGKPINSIEDIFNDDDLGLLNDWSDSIFDIKNISKELTVTNYIAQRKPCPRFNDFEYLFKQCQMDLASGKRSLLPFAKEQQIDTGDFFVLKGILTYVAEVGKKEKFNGKTNARLLCIFENGTESDMLLRSLARELYKDGRRVTVQEDHNLAGLIGLTENDKETGFIYVLKSHNQRQDIQSIKNLHKIGFSRIPIKERIKNAEQEPTYLMAPVTEVASYQCYNLNPQKLEFLLHTFFRDVCLDIDIFDKNGKRHMPREWFIVPIGVIDQAVTFLKTGAIINYRYDPNRQIIVGK